MDRKDDRKLHTPRRAKHNTTLSLAQNEKISRVFIFLPSFQLLHQTLKILIVTIRQLLKFRATLSPGMCKSYFRSMAPRRRAACSSLSTIVPTMVSQTHCIILVAFAYGDCRTALHCLGTNPRIPDCLDTYCKQDELK